MNVIQFISYGINGMLFLSMVFSLILALKNYERKFNIYFVFILLTVIIFNFANTVAVSIEKLTVDQYIIIEKLTNICLILCGIIYLRLITLISGYESKVFFSLLLVYAFSLLVLNHVTQYGIIINEIKSIEKFVAPWGEKLNQITLTTSGFIHYVNIFIVGMIIYMIKASIFAFKNNRKGVGILILTSLLPPVVIVMVVAMLINYDIISPFIGYFFDGLGFSFLTLVIGSQSISEVFKSIDQRRELKEKDDKYRLLFDSANDAIFLMTGGRFVDCNQVSLELYRCTREDIIGKKILTFSPALQPDGISSEDKSIKCYNDLMEGQHQLITWVQRRFDGTFFNAEVQLNKLIINNKVYIQAVVRDITSRIETENKIRNSEEKYRELTDYLEDTVNARTSELAETNKQLESFSYSISHDLRTPLRTVDTFSKMLLEEEYLQLSAEGKHRLQTIRKNTEKMNVMIGDLLTFAQIGRIELKKIPIDVNILVKKVVDELLSAESNRNIKTTIDIMAPVIGDPALLRQAFVNLISNAIKFTRQCEIATIHVGASESEVETTFYVQDNGCGFDMNYSNKLFGVFQRLHSEREFEGTGVGLAVVRRIVQRHGGKVSAYSALNNGARFTITVSKLIL